MTKSILSTDLKYLKINIQQGNWFLTPNHEEIIMLRDRRQEGKKRKEKRKKNGEKLLKGIKPCFFHKEATV